MSDLFQDYFFFAVDKKVHYAMRMVHLSHLVQGAAERHNLQGGLAVLLGEGLLGGMLLSSLLDYGENINVRMQCGEHWTLGTETNFQAKTRGYLEVTPESILVADLEAGKKPLWEFHVRSLRSQRYREGLFEGHTALVTDNLEEALNEHLTQSYQMGARLRLSCWQHEDGTLRAFGWIHQPLPDMPEELAVLLETYLSSLPTPRELFEQNADADALGNALMVPGTGLRGVKSLNPMFECVCSREKMLGALIALSVNERDELFANQHTVEMKCHYCSTFYSFQKSDLDSSNLD